LLYCKNSAELRNMQLDAADGCWGAARYTTMLKQP